ncbi:MAG: molybdate ABC transporter substrate-binding protein [Planctomycetes bacterium]|nr:molybdate ABC transporter substrate-binding protein [Planctomycetota bacterium]
MRRPRLGWIVPFCAALALVLASCGGGDRAIRVFAASSLAPAFEELAREFERAHPRRRVELHCAGSSTLALQLQEGAPADVFASADEANLSKVIEARLTLTDPEVFARNRLALAVPKGNPRRLRGLADLARAELRVALCAPQVPAGRYARECLQKAGVELRSCSDEPSVSALVTKIAFGELDAGLVYATDVRRSDVTELPIPDEWNVVATYPLAVSSTGADSEGGRAFVAFVLSAEGQAILARHGFLRP